MSFASSVQLDPFAFKIERKTIRTLIHLIQLPEVFKLDDALVIDIEKTEGDIVLGIWLDEKIFKCGIVIESDLASIFPVSNLKKDTILVSLDFVLCE